LPSPLWEGKLTFSHILLPPLLLAIFLKGKALPRSVPSFLEPSFLKPLSTLFCSRLPIFFFFFYLGLFPRRHGGFLRAKGVFSPQFSRPWVDLHRRRLYPPLRHSRSPSEATLFRDRLPHAFQRPSNSRPFCGRAFFIPRFPPPTDTRPQNFFPPTACTTLPPTFFASYPPIFFSFSPATRRLPPPTSGSPWSGSLFLLAKHHRKRLCSPALPSSSSPQTFTAFPLFSPGLETAYRPVRRTLLSPGGVWGFPFLHGTAGPLSRPFSLPPANPTLPPTELDSAAPLPHFFLTENRASFPSHQTAAG